MSNSRHAEYRTDAHTDEEIKIAVNELLSKMTIEEKLGQLTQHPGPDFTAIGADVKISSSYEEIKNGRAGTQVVISNVNEMASIIRANQKIAVEESRLGIPLIFCQDVIHGYQTVFPVPLAWSCSWNTELIKNAQQVAAKEASTIGLCLAFSPMVDIGHDPRWGRVVEGAGEDPFLGSLIAQAQVEGFQGKSLNDPSTIVSCVKHFLGYGAAEAGKEYNTCEFSETALRNTYLPPFKAAIEAGTGALMSAFNTVDGTPACGSKKICKNLLRDELKFDGLIISDFAAVKELVAHGVAEDEKESAKLAINATLNCEMGTTNILEHGKKLLEEGEVSIDTVDEAVRRVLTYKYKLGLMEDPYRYLKEDKFNETIYCEEHLKASRELAKRCIVLLKNDGSLPINKAQKVAIIGPVGESKDLLGTWQFSDYRDKVPTIVEGLKSKGIEPIIEQGCDYLEEINGGIEKAVNAAKQADVVLLTLGETTNMSGEAASRLDIKIPDVQQRLAEAVVAIGKPTVLVLTSGRPLILTWYQEHCNAIVETWNLGSQAGLAIADVLVGDYNPSGKLTITFPRHQGQVPLYYNHYNTGRPCINHDPQKYLSKYIDGVNEPLYSFGYGLSYTTFEINNLKISSQTINFNESLNVSVDVKNTGKYAGEETVQLYIHDVAGSIVRPVKELKGFKKVILQPGESKNITFEIKEKLLRFYNQEGILAAEPGRFEVFVGNSSESSDLLKAEFRLTK